MMKKIYCINVISIEKLKTLNIMYFWQNVSFFIICSKCGSKDEDIKNSWFILCVGVSNEYIIT